MAPIRASPRTYSTANDIRCYTNSLKLVWHKLYRARSNAAAVPPLCLFSRAAGRSGRTADRCGIPHRSSRPDRGSCPRYPSRSPLRAPPDGGAAFFIVYALNDHALLGTLGVRGAAGTLNPGEIGPIRAG